MKPSLFVIFIQFLKLGLTSFGGPAMIPYIRDMAVGRKKWLTGADFTKGVGVSQTIPGATAMQMSAYVGLRARGLLGALAAYAGFGLPAFSLMLALSAVYFSYRNMGPVASVFKGLNVVVVALVLHAAISFSKQYLKTWTDKLLALGAGLWMGLNFNPIIAIVGVMALAVLLSTRIDQQQPEGDASSGTHGTLFPPLAVLAGFCVLLALVFIFTPQALPLSLLMAKVDLFAFGGGYVSLPLMLHEVVQVQGWMTEKVFMDGIALGQITPGPIVMTAAFIGYKLFGILGALLATVSVFTPSIFFLTLVTGFMDRMSSLAWTQRALHGSLVSLVGLMAAISGKFALAVDWTPMSAALAVVSFVCLRAGVDVLWVVLGAGAASLLLM